MAAGTSMRAGCRTICRHVDRQRGQSRVTWHRAMTTSRSRPMRLAIIGAGPAGYYVAYRMMKKLPEAHVDMYEALPTPYGLVRFGVAPDHPEVKKSSANLDDVAKWPNFNYVGNVPIGDQPHKLPLATIASHYDSIVFAYGASRDKTLGIPGENLKGVYSARAFVGWYNGLPEFADLEPDLQSGDAATVLGQGNVALDVARVLLTPVDDLKHTDIAEHAIEALSKSRISRVSVVGRRGPLQAPATIKEIRELMQISNTRFRQPDDGWDDHIGSSEKSLPRQLKRIAELLKKGSSVSEADAAQVWEFSYLLSPTEFQGSEHLEAIKFDRMKYERPVTEAIQSIINETKEMAEWQRPMVLLNKIKALKVSATGESTTIASSAAFRSIGYLSEPLDGMSDLGITFDAKRGIIPNDVHGRVLAPDQGPGSLTAAHIPGMYCAGWVKRGPTGVIASTLDDAFRTADILISDWKNGVIFNKRVDGADKVGLNGVLPVLEERNIRSVSWKDWEKLDQEEVRQGKLKGKLREKVVRVDAMLETIDR